jgi:integrase
VDTRGKQRIQRRALNDDEARRLLACPRKLLYLLAMHTGLRRGEINALHGGDFHLDAVNPYWAPPAAFVKNRKEQPRPLHPELVAELQKLKAAGKLKPEDTVFPERVPPMKTIRADFKAAGIPLKDERGHVVDFHALRTTYITRLQRAGVSAGEVLAAGFYRAVFKTASNAGFGLPARSKSSGCAVRPRTGQSLSHESPSVTPQNVTRLTLRRCLRKTENNSA